MTTKARLGQRQKYNVVKLDKGIRSDLDLQHILFLAKKSCLKNLTNLASIMCQRCNQKKCLDLNLKYFHNIL